MEQNLIKVKEELFHKLLVLYILLQPILDIITGIITKNVGNTLSLGVIIRTLFMAAVAIYAIYVAKGKNRVALLCYDAGIAAYVLAFMALSFSKYGLTSIFIQIKGLIKIFYFPVVLMSLYQINKEKRITIDSDVLIYVLFAYTFTIFWGKITGLGYRSYNTIKESLGTVGFFYAANEIGAILCMLGPVLINDIIKNKGNRIFNFVILALLLFSVFEIGTKVPFIGITGALFGCILVCLILFFSKKEKWYLRKSVATVFLIVICFFITAYTPLGNNLNMDYGQIFPKITNIAKSKPKREKEKKTEKEKRESLEKIQEALSSKRDVVLGWNKEKFENGGVPTQMLGIGYLSSSGDEIVETKLVEMDYYDIWFNHGVVGSILIFIPFVIVILYVVKNILMNLKKVFVNSEVIFYAYSVLIGVLIAMLAGHVLTAPSASFLMIIILMQLYYLTENLLKE